MNQSDKPRLMTELSEEIASVTVHLIEVDRAIWALQRRTEALLNARWQLEMRQEFLQDQERRL